MTTLAKHKWNRAIFNKFTSSRVWQRVFSSSHCDGKPVLMTPECKVALITGGAEGMGFAVANHLLKAGAKAVAITGLNSCKGKEAVACLNNAYGRNRAMFINSNVNCMVQLEETFKVVQEAYNNIDIVVNSAAICDGPRWETEVVTNVIGAIRTTLLGYKYVGKEGSGKGGIILNFSGISGLEPFAAVPTLSGCHHAIIGLSRSFGDPIHVARSGVRVVTLCPGITSTCFFKNSHNQGMTDSLSQDLTKVLKDAKLQTADAAGLAGLHLVKYAKSGTVWVVNGSRLFKCTIPTWENYSKLESQFL